MSREEVLADFRRWSPEQGTAFTAHLLQQLRAWGEPVPEINPLDVVWPLYQAALDRRPEVRAAWEAHESPVVHQCFIDGDHEAEPSEPPMSWLATWLFADIWQLLDGPHTVEELHAAIDEIVAARERARAAAGRPS